MGGWRRRGFRWENVARVRSIRVGDGAAPEANGPIRPRWVAGGLDCERALERGPLSGSECAVSGQRSALRRGDRSDKSDRADQSDKERATKSEGSEGKSDRKERGRGVAPTAGAGKCRTDGLDRTARAGASEQWAPGICRWECGKGESAGVGPGPFLGLNAASAGLARSSGQPAREAASQPKPASPKTRPDDQARQRIGPATQVWICAVRHPPQAILCTRSRRMAVPKRGSRMRANKRSACLEKCKARRTP